MLFGQSIVDQIGIQSIMIISQFTVIMSNTLLQVVADSSKVTNQATEQSPVLGGTEELSGAQFQSAFEWCRFPFFNIIENKKLYFQVRGNDEYTKEVPWSYTLYPKLPESWSVGELPQSSCMLRVLYFKGAFDRERFAFCVTRLFDITLIKGFGIIGNTGYVVLTSATIRIPVQACTWYFTQSYPRFLMSAFVVKGDATWFFTKEAVYSAFWPRKRSGLSFDTARVGEVDTIGTIHHIRFHFEAIETTGFEREPIWN